MKISCGVMEDILPLYAEHLAGEDTRKLVEEHLAGCADCQKKLEELAKAPPLSENPQALPLRRLKNTLLIRKLKAVCLAVLTVLTLAVAALACLTTPRYLSYTSANLYNYSGPTETVYLVDEDSQIIILPYPGGADRDAPISLYKNQDGTFFALFREGVSGYDLELVKEGEQTVCFITAWDTVLSSWTGGKNRMQSALLNPNGEEISAIYYCSANGEEDTRLYSEAGEKTEFGVGLYNDADGGVTTLPRLFLRAYLWAALGAGAAALLLLPLALRLKKIKGLYLRIFPLPFFYLAGQLSVKGLTTVTYSPVRDLLFILLIALLLEGIYLLSFSLAAEKRAQKE